MYGRLYLLIIISRIQIVERTAQIAQGTFRPVVLIDYLKFQVEDNSVVEKDLDIQNKIFLIYTGTQNDGICDFCRKNFIRTQMKQGTDKAFQGFVAGLKQGTEKVIVGHTNCHRACGGAEKVRKFRR